MLCARLSFIFFFVIIPIFCSSFHPDLLAASSNFYTYHERWQKKDDGEPGKKEALEGAFRSSADKIASPSGSGALPPSLPVERTLTNIVQLGTFEIEVNQSLIIKSSAGIVKFISTTENIVMMETVDATTLRIIGKTAGRTFIHVWEEGNKRSTFELRVNPQRFVGLTYGDLQRDVLQKSRPFLVTYENSHSSYYRGPKFGEMGRTSLDFNQTVSLQGDTPYGFVTSHAQVQRSGTSSKYIWTDMQAAVRDGRLGRLRNFNAAVGDSLVKPNMMVFSQGRVRGIAGEHWDDSNRLRLESFYGREQRGIFGALSPSIFEGSSERTIDSFLSGNVLSAKINEQAGFRTGFFTGYGRSRVDELNREGFGFDGYLNPNRHISFQPEYSFDNERTAQKENIFLNWDKVQIKGQYRNINKNFQSMLGSPANQGELGYLLETSMTPRERIHFRGNLDVFRDRRIPNPDSLDTHNVHTDMALTVTPTDRSSVIFNYQNLDDTGRVGPNRLRTWGGQYNQTFDLWWGRKASWSVRYQNRQNRSLTNALSSYNNDQLVLNAYTQLFWGIVFSVQREWNWLEEPESDRSSMPQATTYSLNYSRQFFDTPFYLDLNLRIRDEEETESFNSFMTGEDSTEVSGSITYRKDPNWEFYVNGRFENYVPESLNITDPRTEGQFTFGMRHIFDTQIRWLGQANFEGYVFKDMDGDGLKEEGEAGLEGLNIESSDGKKAITDNQGFYKLEGVTGKQATIWLDGSHLPYGFVPTGSLKREVKIENQTTQRIDFGLTPQSEITGVVFNDLNGNGRFDSTDVGVKKVRLILENGKAVRTNISGSYSFSGVLAGDHVVTIDLSTVPDGYLPADVVKKSVKLFEGMKYELHFPLRAQRVVAGRAFFDLNGNDRMDSDENPVEKLRLTLASQVIVTDKEGRFLFTDLEDGDYQMAIDPASLPPGHRADFDGRISLSAEPVTLADVNIPIVAREA